jgi:predicted transcriptional regulator of viral defense system
MHAPDWTRLYALAAAQDGTFTTSQAADAGYSRPLVDHHVKAGRFLRVRRAVYRLRDFPSTDHEDLVVAWLWSDLQGVVSHETALMLHGLSDALPDRIDLTVPTAWRRRRVKVPPLVRLHHADVADTERTWIGPVPVTGPLRTLRDCAALPIPPDLLAQAIAEAEARGLAPRAAIAALRDGQP